MARRRDSRVTIHLDPADPRDASILTACETLYPGSPPSYFIRELLLRAIEDPVPAAVDAARAAAFHAETSEIRKAFGRWLIEMAERLKIYEVT